MTNQVEWPDHGKVKLNTDGTVNTLTRKAYAGGLVWYNNGSWLEGFVFNIGNSSVLGSELWGILKGIQFFWHKGWLNVDVGVIALR